MSTTTRRRSSASNRRDYRPGHFQPRWACEQDGCRESGVAPPETPPADLLPALIGLYEAHVADQHPEAVR